MPTFRYRPEQSMADFREAWAPGLAVFEARVAERKAREARARESDVHMGMIMRKRCGPPSEPLVVASYHRIGGVLVLVS